MSDLEAVLEYLGKALDVSCTETRGATSDEGRCCTCRYILYMCASGGVHLSDHTRVLVPFIR